jgi:hypothetical protein
MADAGYLTGADIAAREVRGLEVHVPIPDTRSSTERHRHRMHTPEAKAPMRQRSTL